MASLTNDNKDIDIPEGLITPHMENKPYYKLYEQQENIDELVDIIMYFQATDSYHDWTKNRTKGSKRTKGKIKDTLKNIFKRIFKNPNVSNYKSEKAFHNEIMKEEILTGYKEQNIDREDLIDILQENSNNKQVYFYIDQQKGFFPAWNKTKIQNFLPPPIVVNTRSTLSDPGGSSKPDSGGETTTAYKDGKIIYALENTSNSVIKYSKFDNFNNNFSDIIVPHSDILSTLMITTPDPTVLLNNKKEQEKKKGKKKRKIANYIWNKKLYSSNLIFLDSNGKLIITDGDYASVKKSFSYSIKNKKSIFNYFQEKISKVWYKNKNKTVDDKKIHSKGSLETMVISKRLGDWLQAFIMTMKKDLYIDTFAFKNNTWEKDDTITINYNKDNQIKYLLTNDRLLRDFALFIGVDGVVYYPPSSRAQIFTRLDRLNVNKEEMKNVLRKNLIDRYNKVQKQNIKTINTFEAIKETYKRFDVKKNKITKELQDDIKTIDLLYQEKDSINKYEKIYIQLLKTCNYYLSYISDYWSYKTFISNEEFINKNEALMKRNIKDIETNEELITYINNYDHFLSKKKNVVNVFNTWLDEKKPKNKNNNVNIEKSRTNITLFNEITAKSWNRKFKNFIWNNTTINNQVGEKTLVYSFNIFNDYVESGFVDEEFLLNIQDMFQTFFKNIEERKKNKNMIKDLEKIFNFKKIKKQRGNKKYAVLEKNIYKYYDVKRAYIEKCIGIRNQKGGDPTLSVNNIFNVDNLFKYLTLGQPEKINYDITPLNKEYVMNDVKNTFYNTLSTKKSPSIGIFNDVEMYLSAFNYSDIFMDRIIYMLNELNINYNDIRPDDYVSSILFYLNNPTNIIYTNYTNIEKIIDPNIYALHIDSEYFDSLNNDIQYGGEHSDDEDDEEKQDTTIENNDFEEQEDDNIEEEYVEIQRDLLNNVNVIEIFKGLIDEINSDTDLQPSEKKSLVQNHIDIYVFYLYLNIIKKEKQDIYIRKLNARDEVFDWDKTIYKTKQPDRYSPELLYYYEDKTEINGEEVIVMVECSSKGNPLKMEAEENLRIKYIIQQYVNEIINEINDPLLKEYGNYSSKIPTTNLYHRRILIKEYEPDGIEIEKSRKK